MNVSALSVKDFTTDQEVRWCPGCGDYAILKAVRSALADLGRAPHDVAFVSGIGCAARFPYYVDTYGFHTIHGRAPAVATGVKIANPDLDVWVVGGDGDFLSIGGNHVFHALRRNVDLNLLMLNNAIYGLTKGQYSPTSAIGTRSPSTPEGSVDAPVNAVLFALGAGAGFVARSADTLQAHLKDTLVSANRHKGASFVEVLQNCPVFNDGTWGEIADKKKSADLTITVEAGEPLLFGKEKQFGLELDPATGKFRKIGVSGEADLARVAVHDPSDRARASLLAELTGPDMPMALGVLYCDDRAEFIAEREARVPDKPLTREDLGTLIGSAHTWEVR